MQGRHLGGGDAGLVTQRVSDQSINIVEGIEGEEQKNKMFSVKKIRKIK